MRQKILAASLGVALLVSAVAAAAAEWPKVETQQAGGVNYVVGGFGIEERQVMPGGYPFKVMFATDKGNYLARVDVAIADAAGKSVFELKEAPGPWLLVDLKPGSYKLTATQNGKAKGPRAFTVGAKGTTTLLVTWKTTEVDMGLP